MEKSRTNSKFRAFGKLLLAAFFIVLLSNCIYHNESEYFAATPADTCNTQNMSYQNDIKSILEANCLACHKTTNASFGINLEGYAKVKPYAQSGELSKVINHVAGYDPMPKNASKMSDCDIAKIDAWIEQGIQNN